MKKIILSRDYSIRKMSLKDILFYNNIRNECREFLHNHTRYSLGESKRWFNETSPLFFILIYREEKIGYFRTSEWQDDKSVFVGMDLHSDFRGLNHAQKSYPLFLNYLKERYGINRFYLRVLKNNNRAKHLYNKIGFKVIEETDVDFKMELR